VTGRSDDPVTFVDDGGISERPTSSRDPFELLDDLMTVVEALCPQWPARGTFEASSRYLI
jgi:hypothetical protein